MAPSGDGGAGPIADDARRRLEAIRAALMREIEALLLTLDQTGGELASTKDALDNARKIRRQVIALLHENGLPVVITTAEGRIVEAVDTALRNYTPPRGAVPDAGIVSFTMEAEAKDAIAHSVGGVLDDIAAVFGEGEQAIRAAVDVGLNTAAPLGDLIENVRAVVGTTFARAATAVDTAIRGAARATLVRQAERGAEETGEEVVYLYSGPDEDAKIREFCAEHVGKAFTLDALRRLDNGQGLPVESFAGGYNCRHQIVPLTREMADEEGITVVDT